MSISPLGNQAAVLAPTPDMPAARGGGIVFPRAFHPLQDSPQFDGLPEQCAEWVSRTFRQAGHPLPFAGNGQDFYPNAAGQPGFEQIPNGSGQLPRAGDIIGFAGGGFGHVAIVSKVYIDPQDPKKSWVQIAQANFADGGGNPNRDGNGFLSERLPLDPTTGAVGSADPHLTVQGFVRPDAAHALLPPDQMAALQAQPVDPNQSAFDGSGPDAPVARMASVAAGDAYAAPAITRPSGLALPVARPAAVAEPIFDFFVDLDDDLKRELRELGNPPDPEQLAKLATKHGHPVARLQAYCQQAAARGVQGVVPGPAGA